MASHVSATFYYLIVGRLPVSNIRLVVCFRSLRVFCVRRMVDGAGVSFTSSAGHTSAQVVVFASETLPVSGSTASFMARCASETT